MRSSLSKNWILVIAVLAFFYIGLFITMWWWYPAGLSPLEWRAHVRHFSFVYVLWLLVFFVYRLFDLDTLRAFPVLLSRLLFALIICAGVAVGYFYFQPQLLLTPRRFLLVHIILSGLGIVLWYALMYVVLPRTWKRIVLAHALLPEKDQLVELLNRYSHLGIRYGGELNDQSEQIPVDAIVVLPIRSLIDGQLAQSLFALRSKQVRFIEYHELHERLTRTIHLDMLNELWFLHSVDYGMHRIYETAKRCVDIAAGIIAAGVFIVTLPLVVLLIKLDSRGPVFFTQPRVGLLGQQFRLVKYRTMDKATYADWNQAGDRRITRVGKWLRKLRIDELPQVINILKGDMSVVGPRPEQVHFVEQLREQIPYYDERHIVKPGLTGWSQLHVYASTLEETKRKLQYDLYYIKHRSLLFDLEIVLKTIYNIITFNGR